MSSVNPQHEIVLSGLDGANPLGFLAALGTLCVLDRTWRERHVRLRWDGCSGYRAVIAAHGALSVEEVISGIRAGLTPIDGFFPKSLVDAALKSSPQNKKGKPKWEGKLRLPAAAFRAHLKETRHSNRDTPSFALAWGHEFATKEYEKIECIEPTPFDFTAGNQGFPRMVSDLCAMTDRIDFRETLFGPWRYADKEPSLRWDPLDDRRYALRWTDPTREDVQTVWGANRLALEGLAFYPNIVTATGRRIPGLTEHKGKRRWRWPLWRKAASVPVVRAVILTAGSATEAQLRAMGVAAMIESAIVQPTGYYRNFTPGMPV